jgi:ubiquitin C-terminal hydrolase
MVVRSNPQKAAASRNNPCIVSTEELDKMAVVNFAKNNYTLDMSDGEVKKIIIMNFCI